MQCKRRQESLLESMVYVLRCLTQRNCLVYGPISIKWTMGIYSRYQRKHYFPELCFWCPWIFWGIWTLSIEISIWIQTCIRLLFDPISYIRRVSVSVCVFDYRSLLLVYQSSSSLVESEVEYVHIRLDFPKKILIITFTIKMQARYYKHTFYLARN